MNKQNYIKIINEKISGSAKDILLKQIDLFYDINNQIEKNKYDIGESVKLKKGTFIHGIFGELENFDFTIKNGFISTDFTSITRQNKIKYSVGMWNIQTDMLLKDYINQYSGFTISYSIGRGPEAKTISKLIPFHKFDLVTEKINNDNEIWTYYGEQTKEVRFIPSLVSDKKQIAFILNMESDYAKKLDYRYKEKFINQDRVNRNAITTDRESAIMFGLPINLVEGIFVGRKLEMDEKKLKYIKPKLPDCYICNLDGKVVVGNK